MASSVPPEPDTFDPVLIHGAGIAVWGNRAFIERFGVDPAAIKRLKVRELLWSLGLQDPLARIIAEGAIFTDLVAESIGARRAANVHLRQCPMPGNLLPAGQEGGRLMLVFAEGGEGS